MPCPILSRIEPLTAQWHPQNRQYLRTLVRVATRQSRLGSNAAPTVISLAEALGHPATSVVSRWNREAPAYESAALLIARLQIALALLAVRAGHRNGAAWAASGYSSPQAGNRALRRRFGVRWPTVRRAGFHRWMAQFADVLNADAPEWQSPCLLPYVSRRWPGDMEAAA